MSFSPDGATDFSDFFCSGSDESDDMDRRNSAVIIASPGEANVFPRNIDFCKVSVLMCELLLLIGKSAEMLKLWKRQIIVNIT